MGRYVVAASYFVVAFVLVATAWYELLGAVRTGDLARAGWALYFCGMYFVWRWAFLHTVLERVR